MDIVNANRDEGFHERKLLNSKIGDHCLATSRVVRQILVTVVSELYTDVVVTQRAEVDIRDNHRHLSIRSQRTALHRLGVGTRHRTRNGSRDSHRVCHAQSLCLGTVVTHLHTHTGVGISANVIHRMQNGRDTEVNLHRSTQENRVVLGFTLSSSRVVVI